jgi:hypothetical protein
MLAAVYSICQREGRRPMLCIAAAASSWLPSVSVRSANQTLPAGARLAHQRRIR